MKVTGMMGDTFIQMSMAVCLLRAAMDRGSCQWPPVLLGVVSAEIVLKETWVMWGNFHTFCSVLL